MAASFNPSGSNNNNNYISGRSNNYGNNNGNGIEVYYNSVVGHTRVTLRHNYVNSGIPFQWTPEERSLLDDLLANETPMAASSKPSGGNHNSNNSNGRINNNGNTIIAGLRHDSAISLQWTPEEQSILNDLLEKYASEVNAVRYVKIATQMKDKTCRDVALRCNWMSKNKSGKRQKEDHSRKNNYKKEKVTDSLPKSSQSANRTNGPPYAQPIAVPTESDEGISFKAIGGTTGQLLEQNAEVLDQISANFTSFKIHENINLLCQARNNILTILNDGLYVLPEVMKQMPPLPVKLNEELANSILPRPQWSKY